MSAADIDAVGTQPLGHGNHITKSASTDAPRDRRSRDRGIDHHGQPGTGPRLKQTHWFRDAGYNANMLQRKFVQRGGGGGAYAVILPIAIAEANNYDLTGHRWSLSVHRQRQEVRGT
jgi:hypothetical protein